MSETIERNVVLQVSSHIKVICCVVKKIKSKIQFDVFSLTSTRHVSVIVYCNPCLINSLP